MSITEAVKITDPQLRDGQLARSYTIWFCGVCTVVSSGCPQYSHKWWGRVKLLLGLMRLPAAPHCLTKSPSVYLPSRHVFAQHHASPLNHTSTTFIHTCTISPYLPFKCFFFSCLCLIYSLSIFLLFCSPCPFSSLLIAATLCRQPLLLLLSPVPAGVLCNWAVVNSTLAWISSVATSGWCCWPLQTQAK